MKPPDPEFQRIDRVVVRIGVGCTLLLFFVAVLIWFTSKPTPVTTDSLARLPESMRSVEGAIAEIRDGKAGGFGLAACIALVMTPLARSVGAALYLHGRRERAMTLIALAIVALLALTLMIDLVVPDFPHTRMPITP